MWVAVRGQKAGRSGWLLRLLFQVVVDQRLLEDCWNLKFFYEERCTMLTPLVIIFIL